MYSVCVAPKRAPASTSGLSKGLRPIRQSNRVDSRQVALIIDRHASFPNREDDDNRRLKESEKLQPILKSHEFASRSIIQSPRPTSFYALSNMGERGTRCVEGN